MRRFCFWITLLTVGLLTVSAGGAEPARGHKGLDVYFIDTEGGAATLIVTPLGESVLIDCGNPGTRDANRIHHVAAEVAGLKAIDNLAITHWHTDHYGSIDRLTQLIPIRHYYDRGVPDTLAEDVKNFPLLIQAYKSASQGKATTLKPGDTIPLKQPEHGPHWRLLCLCARSEVMPDKPGAPLNPVAKEHQPQPDDPTDNAKSLGFLLSFGGFRFLDLGDLTWNIEYKLVHPSDKIGLIDVYQSTHHGLEISNNPVVIKTVKPRVAIFNNGARKGGHPSVMATLRRVPDLQAIFQMHRNLTSAAQENTDPEYIANADEDCQGEHIHLSVAPDGKSYTVQIGEKGKQHRYETRLKGGESKTED
jgi:beta-lactamase superfamily II metal-dependent hydrolase